MTLKGVASSDLGEVKKELTFKQVADNTMEGKMILTVGAQVVSGDLLATRPGPEPYSGSPGYVRNRHDPARSPCACTFYPLQEEIHPLNFLTETLYINNNADRTLKN